MATANRPNDTAAVSPEDGRPGKMFMKWHRSLLVALSVSGLFGLCGQAFGSTNATVAIVCTNIPMHECIKNVENAYSVSIYLNTKLERENISVDVRQPDALHAVMTILDTLDRPNYAVLSENQGKRYRVTVFGQGVQNASQQVPLLPVAEPQSLHREDGNTVGSEGDGDDNIVSGAQAQPSAPAENNEEAGVVPKGMEGAPTVEAVQPEMAISAYRQADIGASPPLRDESPMPVPAQPEQSASAAAQPDNGGAGNPENGSPTATTS